MKRAATQDHAATHGHGSGGGRTSAGNAPGKSRRSGRSADDYALFRVAVTEEQAASDLAVLRLVADRFDQPDGFERAQRAFDSLTRTYQVPLERAVARVLRRQRASIQDVVQDTWERVWTRPGSYLGNIAEREKPVANWIFLIARNLSIDRLRRTRQEVLVDGTSDALSEPINASALDSWRDREVDTAIADSADAVLSAIPPHRREVLTLVHYHDLSSSEAAALLDRSNAFVRSTIHVARREARARLAAAGISSLSELVASD
ncbi:MAG: RNA polymerase sigma factor [Ferrovibrionaceae bacterium]